MAWLGEFCWLSLEMCVCMIMVRLPGCLGFESDEDAMMVRRCSLTESAVAFNVFITLQFSCYSFLRASVISQA